jgi:UDP-N-acetyl-2-amino-2-deoxyglucuronate dehydrogenase
MKKNIKFAIIGYGYIGKRHAAYIHQNPNASLVAIVDELDTSTTTDTPFFDSLESLYFSKIEVDVLVIATPNALHEKHATSALDNNMHVLIEKPLALTKASCEKIIFKALEKQKLVFCVMQNRYTIAALWLKDLIKNNLLGNINMVQINCFWNRDTRYYSKSNWHGKKAIDGGVLFTQFSHFVDLLYWCFGDVICTSVKTLNFNHQQTTEFEDTGIVQFELTTGGIGSINFTTSVWDKNQESSLTVIAEKGSLKISGQYLNEIDYCHINNYVLPDELKSHQSSKENHQFVIQNVIDVLSGEGPIATNAMEGMKVVEIIESIYNKQN